ncbi:MAG: FGGY-family carbohydrate kinase [Leptolyngbyaceae cyanobacterium]
MASYFAGLDFGTSGARLAVIDADQQAVVGHHTDFASVDPQDWPQQWLSALRNLLASLAADVRSQLRAIAINGTSATVLLCNEVGQPVTPPLLYNDARGQTQQEFLATVASAGSPALSATSSLAKLLWWRQTLPSETCQEARHLMHQADWLACHLHGQMGLTDYHNALKLGYDVDQLRYPDWLSEALQPMSLTAWLPEVQAPGSLFGLVSAAARAQHGLPNDCVVIAGTTDSIAAFLASGAKAVGEAVTSLGSTLVIKLVSPIQINDSRYGIYSHRLGACWLVGGASNTGGAVLKQFFTDAELETLSARISPEQASPLRYYPLPKPGERFPLNDPQLLPQISPRPKSDVEFLHGLLEGIARIEAQGYQRLTELGAPPVKQVYTAGGGAKNQVWQTIRQRCLSVPVVPAEATDAALGTAKLAYQGWLAQPTETEA